MKKILILLFCGALSFFHSNCQSLTNITPNNALQTQTVTVSVTASGVYFQGVNMHGHIQNVYLQFGIGDSIMSNFATINYTNDSAFTIDFSIPAAAITGLYDFHVDYLDTANFPFPTIIPMLSYQVFSIGNIDGFISGNVYLDINKNGIRDANETGIPNQSVNISGLNQTVLSDANGNYNFGVSNGTYTVQWINNPNDYYFSNSPTISVQINNNTQSGNDFGLKHSLISVAPNVAVPTQSIQVTLISDSLFQSGANPNGNIAQIVFQSVNSGFYFNVNPGGTNIQVINYDTAIINVLVPGSGTFGLFDIRVEISSVFTGFHYLRHSFSIAFSPSSISGKVYVDVNTNGIYDNSDYGISGRKILVMPDNILCETDTSGNYYTRVQNGVYNVFYVADAGYPSASPSFYSLPIVNQQIINKDFGVTSGSPQYSGTVGMFGMHRCNTVESFNFTYVNQSNVSTTGVIYAVGSSNMVVQNASPAPDFTNGDTLFWNFSNVSVDSIITKIVYYQLPTTGDTISYFAFVKCTNGGSTVFQKSYSGTNIVSCVQMAVDKSVFPIGIGTYHYTLNSQPLLFTIHFQNTTGNTVSQVIVYDALDADLDWTTFQITGSSHNVMSELNRATGLLKFTFNNINLPDSSVNFTASNGYVAFSVLPKTGLADMTVINNTAGISFDSANPVATNPTFNTLVSQFPNAVYEIRFTNSLVKITPNPFDNSALIYFENQVDEKYLLTVYSITGNLVMNKELLPDKHEIKKENLKPGLYFYSLSSPDKTKIFHGKFAIN